MLALNDRAFDVAVVGGGPAGLTAATYLARFLRSVVVIDGGDARASQIPLTRNCPGFPAGISGEALLQRLRSHASNYGAEVVQDTIISIEAGKEDFTLSTASGPARASFVILATGIIDKVPSIPDLRRCIASGLVRLCPVCDAYETIGKSVGIIGSAEAALAEALFLRDYTSRVCILVDPKEDVGSAQHSRAASAGIQVLHYVSAQAADSGIQVVLTDGTTRCLDTVYSAMGCEVRSELGACLGADCDESGYIVISEHQETSVPRLYAIGDVAKALNQLSVGFGHAALAAAHINKALRETQSENSIGSRA